jgi:hypothetical protein
MSGESRIGIDDIAPFRLIDAAFDVGVDNLFDIFLNLIVVKDPLDGWARPTLL